MKITEPNTIHERVDTLVRYFCKGNKTAFGRETDILPGVLASITGGRMSKPSFELLQKIMIRYPAINGDWLLLGREPMLKDDDTGMRYITVPLIDKHLEQTLQRIEESKAVMIDFVKAMNPEAARQVRQRAESAEGIANLKNSEKLYHVGSERELDPNTKLATRLGISEDEAQSLVASFKIRATDLGGELGFRVSEQAVLDFLGESNKP
jgi:hypothetical protein